MNYWNEVSISLDGSNVVWNGTSSVSPDEIYFYDGNAATQVTDNNYRDDYLQIDGSNVVWCGEVSDDNWESFLYDGLTVTQLTDNIYRDFNPEVSGSVYWLVWCAHCGKYHWHGPGEGTMS